MIVVRAENEYSEYVPLPTRRSGPAEVAAITEHFSIFVPILPYATGGGDGGTTPTDPCGDSSCGANETCDTCPIDCGLCPPPSKTDGGAPVAFCGNLVCDGTNGETCATCPYDCGECGSDAGVNPGGCSTNNGGCDPQVSCRPITGGVACGVCPIGTTNPNGACVACTASGVDTPDVTSSFVDSDCDGVDGDVASMLFVAPFGDDELGTGSPSSPFATIGRALTVAQVSGITAIAVAEGSYPETVLAVDGVSIHGGYVAVGGWWRSADPVAHASVLRPVLPELSSYTGEYETIGYEATGITRRTILDRFRVEAGQDLSVDPVPLFPSTSNYAIRVAFSPMSMPGNGLELHNVRAIAHQGTPGKAGTTGGNGPNGQAGGGGAAGVMAATLAAPGGMGGLVDCPYAPPSALPVDANGGSGGAGGIDPTPIDCPSGNASDGLPGVPPAGDLSCQGGLGGTGVSLCSGVRWPASTGRCARRRMPAWARRRRPRSFRRSRRRLRASWFAHAGDSGWAGTNGLGGPGGGGGGAGDGASPAGWGGGGGGGGGAGGCGGNGGQGGTAGGSSIGLLVTSTTSVTVVASTFEARSGGAGGNGGNGGSGGVGGGGGPGGAGVGGPANLSQGGGGAGGPGLNGFGGGGGGGGPGGVSIAQVVCMSGVTGIDATTGLSASGGAGGTGGAPGGHPATNGFSSTLYNGCGFSPFCGDYVVEGPVEECDDGPSGSASCSTLCLLQ